MPARKSTRKPAGAKAAVKPVAGEARKARAARAPQRLLGRVALDTDAGAFLGAMRIRLLEGIERLGSITQAARSVPLSYKAAWDAINEMNNVAGQPLVERSVGGVHGGGARVTAYGRRLVAFFRAMEEDYQGIVDRVALRMGGAGGEDVRDYRAVIRRLAMKTSARNQFYGPVTALREGAVSYEVRLRLDEHNELTAVITRASAEGLGLRVGAPVHAFVKASSVILATGKPLRTTARNQLWGSVSTLCPGAVNDEVELTLPSGRTVVSVITHDSLVRLGLVVGASACALFSASSVILASFD